MKRYMTAWVFLLCLMLTACGGKHEDQTSAFSEPEKLNEEAVLLTVDGREVPAWKYLYWLTYACDQVREKYQKSGLPLDWETPVSGGTLASYVKDQALANTALYATVENWAERYGCTTAEGTERTGILPDMGFETEQIRELERVGDLYSALYERYCTEGSELAPTQEALEDYGQKQGAMTLDRILVAAGEDRDVARQKAEELFAQLNGAENQETAFSSLAAMSDDPAGPRTVLPKKDDLDPVLLEAGQALQEGQCSGILESEEGFFVLRRLALETDAVAEDYFDDLLQTAAENAVIAVTSAYDALDPVAYHAALEQVRQTEK